MTLGFEFLVFTPPKLKTGTQTDTMYMLWTCTPMFIAALFTVAKSGNNRSVHQLMKE